MEISAPSKDDTTYYPDGNKKEVTAAVCSYFGSMHQYYDENGRCTGYDLLDRDGKRTMGMAFGPDGSQYSVAERGDGSERMTLRDANHTVSIYDLGVEGVPTLLGSYTDLKGGPAFLYIRPPDQ
ncbi:MAG TPA: hypothetical protein VGL08_13670 [Paraburkholderia sp.]|jgi:hypothetical protein